MYVYKCSDVFVSAYLHFCKVEMYILYYCLHVCALLCKQKYHASTFSYLSSGASGRKRKFQCSCESEKSALWVGRRQQRRQQEDS